jgi:hypothetical protein
MADSKEDMEMKVEELYREEMFTDLRMGTIRRLIPIKADGSDDTSRKIRFSGQAQIMTPSGALPISFEIEANTIGEAAAAFGPEAEKAIEDTVRKLEEMRRQAASGIVLPGAGDVSKVAGGGLIKP